MKMGGYDEQMIFGSCDHEFALRLRHQQVSVHYAKDAVIEHQPITFMIDVRSHYGYGLGMYQIDRKYGGNYGKDICLKRFAPKELWKKFLQRGPVSVLRSVMLGVFMLQGYRHGKSGCIKPRGDC